MCIFPGSILIADDVFLVFGYNLGYFVIYLLRPSFLSGHILCSSHFRNTDFSSFCSFYVV